MHFMMLASLCILCTTHFVHFYTVSISQEYLSWILSPEYLVDYSTPVPQLSASYFSSADSSYQIALRIAQLISVLPCLANFCLAKFGLGIFSFQPFMQVPCPMGTLLSAFIHNGWPSLSILTAGMWFSDHSLGWVGVVLQPFAAATTVVLRL
jgi:hypothetical protein